MPLNELGGSGCFVGYRRIWARLRRKGYMVKRITVMIQRELRAEKGRDFAEEYTMQKGQLCLAH